MQKQVEQKHVEQKQEDMVEEDTNVMIEEESEQGYTHEDKIQMY